MDGRRVVKGGAEPRCDVPEGGVRERTGPVQSQCGFWREEGGPNSVGVALEGPQRSQPSLSERREK